MQVVLLCCCVITIALPSCCEMERMRGERRGRGLSLCHHCCITIMSWVGRTRGERREGEGCRATLGSTFERFSQSYRPISLYKEN